MDLRNNIIRMYPNIKAMLIDRGYTLDSIPNTDFTNILEYKIKEFMDDEEDTTRILDFFVTNGETKDYVFFYKGSEKGFKINKVFFEKKVQKYFKEIESVKGLNINFDNFTFVLVKRKISKVEKELVDNFESSNPHIRICDYEKFLFNITAHKLVSKHRLYKKSYRTLLKKLMLDTPDKLPYILHADPISKHFNFRDGEIIEITRDTLGKKITMYRICKNFNYSHLSYKSGLPKSDPPPPLEDVEELEDTVTVEDDVDKLNLKLPSLKMLYKIIKPRVQDGNWWLQKKNGTKRTNPESNVRNTMQQLLEGGEMSDYEQYKNSLWYKSNSEWDAISNKQLVTSDIKPFLKSFFNFYRISSRSVFEANIKHIYADLNSKEVATVKEDVEETGESDLVEDNDEAGEEEGDMIEEDVENEGEEDDLSEEVKEKDEDKGHGVNLKKIIKLKKKF